MSKEDKRSGGCNCKASKEVEDTKAFIRKYGSMEDKFEQDEVGFWSYFEFGLINFITLLLFPFLFMYVLVNLVVNLCLGKGLAVNVKFIQDYIKKHNE